MKYKITYTEGLHINVKEIIEAENRIQALLLFYEEHPNASHDGIAEATQEEEGGDAQ